MRKRSVRILVSLALTAATLYLALRGVDFPLVRSALSMAEALPIGLGVLGVVVGVIFKIVRWQLLLSAAGFPVPFLPAAASFLAGQALNIVYPLRVGEISRMAVIGAGHGEPARVAASLVVEKALDLVTFLGLIFWQLLIAPLPDWLARPVRVLFVGAAVGLVAGGWILAYRRQLTAVVLQRLAPQQWRPALTEQVNRLADALAGMSKVRSLALTAAFTAPIWLAALLPNALAGAALGLRLPFGAILLTLIAVQIGISVPALPVRIGVFEFACILALQAFGVDRTTALSYGILLHAIVYLPVLGLGLPALWMTTARRAKL